MNKDIKLKNSASCHQSRKVAYRMEEKNYIIWWELMKIQQHQILD